MGICRLNARINVELRKTVGGGRGAAGAEVDRCRRENWGAEGAQRGGAWGPHWGRVWGGAVPPPHKMFDLGLNIVSFGAFCAVFFTVQLLVLHSERYNLVLFPIIFILFFHFK